MNRIRQWAWIWLPLSFFVMCAGWALTSPPGSSPDDDFHLSSIWCAGGTRAGVCEQVPGHPDQRAVPAAVVNAAECFAFKPEVSAACVKDLPAGLVATDRVNVTANLYPGGYYRVMSILVGPDVERSVLVMRLANAGLAALLLALLIRVVPVGISRAALLAVTITFVPLGLFLVASTNPSGWAVVGLTLYLAFAYALLVRTNWRSRRTWLIAGGVLVTGLMAVTSRLDAAVFVIIATVLALVLAGVRHTRQGWIAALLLFAISVFGAYTYLGHGTPTFAGEGTGVGGAEPGVGLLLTNATYLPILFVQALGFGGLGWNDTVLPPLVGVVGVVAVGALAYAGLAVLTRRKAWAVVLAFAALILVPLVVLQRDGLAVGEAVQPRYLLPLLAMLVLVLCLGPSRAKPLELSGVPAIALAVALCLSAVLAYWANAHRYFGGSATGLFDFKLDPAWLSVTGVPLWLTTLITGAAGTVFVAGVLVTARQSARRG